uniref:Sucrose nonfermenting 4-like protein n=1 Tax=Noccaea caerulescens TaxID=107243 RepID=A0A1J3FXM1_NOCCA
MFGSTLGSSRENSAASGQLLTPTRFVWPYGGRRVFLSGSFTRWTEHVPMSPLEGCPTVFQVICNLTPGYHQYKFFVDGEWRHDEHQPFVSGNGGVMNTIFITGPDMLRSGFSPAAHDRSSMDVDDVIVRMTDSSQETIPRMSGIDLEVSRHRISVLLSTRTAYELLPESGKVIALDVNLPVKQAFHILYEQGIPLAPLWDFGKGQFVGVLGPLDFILILRELGTHGSNLTEEELETHTIAAWKEGKAHISRQFDGSGRPYPRPLVQIRGWSFRFATIMTVKECEERITQLEGSLGELHGEVTAIKVGCEEMSLSHKETLTRLGLMEQQMTGITETLSRLEALAFSSQDRGKGTTSSSFESPQVTLPHMESLGSRGISGALENRDSLLRKIDMPVFDGCLPYCWILRGERFFRLGQYAEEEKLGLVSLCLDEAVLNWFNGEAVKAPFSDWSQFKNRFLARFAPVRSCSPREVLMTKELIPEIGQEEESSTETKLLQKKESMDPLPSPIGFVLDDMHSNFGSDDEREEVYMLPVKKEPKLALQSSCIPTKPFTYKPFDNLPVKLRREKQQGDYSIPVVTAAHSKRKLRPGTASFRVWHRWRNKYWLQINKYQLQRERRICRSPHLDCNTFLITAWGQAVLGKGVMIGC